MRRLLTDEQVESIAPSHVLSLVAGVYLARPLEMSTDDFARQVHDTIGEKVVECLEGLMEPEEGRERS